MYFKIKRIFKQINLILTYSLKRLLIEIWIVQSYSMAIRIARLGKEPGYFFEVFCWLFNIPYLLRTSLLRISCAAGFSIRKRGSASGATIPALSFLSPLKPTTQVIEKSGGGYWDWTSDPSRVKRMLSRWANPPFNTTAGKTERRTSYTKDTSSIYKKI